MTASLTIRRGKTWCGERLSAQLMWPRQALRPLFHPIWEFSVASTYPIRNYVSMTHLAQRLRFCAAICLVALYAICVVRPSVAFADGGATTYCLGEYHRDLAAMDVHGSAEQNGEVHARGAEAAQKDTNSTPRRHGAGQQEQHVCADCSLPCFRVVPNNAVLVQRPNLMLPLFALLDEILRGRGPGRISRPPIAVLSL
jgi:hypothetical protein